MVNTAKEAQIGIVSRPSQLARNYQRQSFDLLEKANTLIYGLCGSNVAEQHVFQAIFAWDYARKAGREIYTKTHNPFLLADPVAFFTTFVPHSFESQTKAERELKAEMKKALSVIPLEDPFFNVALRTSNMFLYCYFNDPEFRENVNEPGTILNLIEPYRQELQQARIQLLNRE